MSRHWFSSSILVVLVPLGLWAQAGGPTPFGSGAVPQLSFAGAAAPSNLVSFSVSSTMGYNTNIAAVGQGAEGGTFVSLGPRISVVRQGEHVVLDLDYYPNYLFYPGHEQYDQFNQALALNMSFKLGPRITLQIRDSLSRATANFQPGLSNSSVSIPGLGPPTTLNQTVYTGSAPQQNNAARVDLTYRKSGRTSFGVFAGFDQQHFIGKPANGQQLFNTQGTSGGLRYAYRISEHTSLGVVYLYQDFNFARNQSLIGAQSRTVTHSVFASFAWQLAPSVTLSVFGGPQYIPSEEYFVQSPILPGGSGTIVNPLFRSQWNEAAGGALTKQAEKTAFSLTAQRSVSNGGGLLTAAISSSVGMGASRKLRRGWDANFNLTFASTDNLTLPSLPRNQISTETATLALNHPLSESLSAQLSYTFVHQSNVALLPVAATLDSSRLSLSFSYRAKSIPLSH